MNTRPDVYLERFGWFHLERHDEMKLLFPDSGHPLKYFVEPVVQVVNFLEHPDPLARCLGLIIFLTPIRKQSIQIYLSLQLINYFALNVV